MYPQIDSATNYMLTTHGSGWVIVKNVPLRHVDIISARASGLLQLEKNFPVLQPLASLTILEKYKIQLQLPYYQPWWYNFCHFEEEKFLHCYFDRLEILQWQHFSNTSSKARTITINSFEILRGYNNFEGWKIHCNDNDINDNDICNDIF